jgi:hypothetical protein
MHLLLLAQTAETAAEGVSLIERVLAGGVPLICLVIAAICGYAFYKQLLRNNTLETTFREKVEGLLREMLDRDRESQEAVSAAIQAVEAFQVALTNQQKANEDLGRKIERLEDSLRRRDGGT